MQIGTAFESPPLKPCCAARIRGPSAKPCRMPGMDSQLVRTKLRAGDLDGWRIYRLLAVAASLGLRAEISLLPTEPAPTAR